MSKTVLCIVTLLRFVNRSSCDAGILRLRRLGCIAIAIRIAIGIGFYKTFDCDSDPDSDTIVFPDRA